MIEKVNVSLGLANFSLTELQQALPEYMQVVSKVANDFVIEVHDAYDALDEVTKALNEAGMSAYVRYPRIPEQPKPKKVWLLYRYGLNNEKDVVGVYAAAHLAFNECDRLRKAEENDDIVYDVEATQLIE